MTKRALALVAALALSTEACAPYGYGYHHVHSGGDARGIGAAIQLFAIVAEVAVTASEHSRAREVVVEEPVEAPPVLVVDPPPMVILPSSPGLPPRVTAADPTHRAFDSTAALAAIHAIDLSACGAPRGYTHARVTFDANGRATRVVIDEPAGLSKEAVTCLGDRIGRASAPPFEGSPVTVGAGFYVR